MYSLNFKFHKFATLTLGVFLVPALLLLAVSAHAQKTPAAENEGKIFLRVISLLPITKQRLSLSQGEKMICSNIGNGFYTSYVELSTGEAVAKLTLKCETKTPEKISLKKYKGADVFHTLVIYGDGKTTPKFTLYNDNTPSSASEQSAPLGKRFRGFFGGYPFSYSVTVEGVGQWDIEANTPQLVELSLEGKTAPAVFSVTYRTRYGYSATVYYPLWFETNDQCSAVVFQRGPTRPRLFSLPDNVVPSAENGEAASQPAEENSEP